MAVRLISGAVALTLSASCASASAADDEVKIGLDIPLSPPGDPAAGQLIRRGADLAVEYVNSHGGVLGGKKIALAVQDGQGRTEAGVAGYRRLATEEKVVGVTGFFHSSVTMALNEVATELGPAPI